MLSITLLRVRQKVNTNLLLFIMEYKLQHRTKKIKRMKRKKNVKILKITSSS